uniref:Dihydrolipoamide acetyltransferase component of pyruvate dehydrogenase complex n=1 Tax=Thraustochytrium sp. LLF1b TaxID=1112570 RepID=A0A455ZA82_9STRA|nr:TPA_exp: mitochondrial branched-chain alpha-keto acid dehydrogenase complex lipoamide acyltransferase component [Thraustochytrium sp. LLF1b]|mmetsp:Transcript_14531/g.26069  ORF Transcript_14531/g.26069 Transcript_14531/m.26069 type:complete len:510 (+) Transcript_14531:126-1655(+)
MLGRIARSWGRSGRVGFVRGFHGSRFSLGQVPFKLADIGEGIAEVEVLQWFVEPGDTVKQFDKICEVQSDKATVEITSRYDGVVQSLNWKVGDMAKVGETLVELEVDGVDTPAAVNSDDAAPQEEKQEEPEPEPVAPPPEVPATLKRMGSFSVDPVIRPPSEEVAYHAPPRASPDERILATPAVRRLARDHSLNLEQVPATGKGGRVLKGDVLAYIASVPVEERQRQANLLRSKEQANVAGAPEPASAVPASGKAAPASSAAPAVPTPVTKLAEDVVVPVKGIQRIMVKSMEASLKIPHFNFMEEYEMSDLAEFRTKLKANAEQRGVKLSYMPILIKAASLALVQYPGLNAHFNVEQSEVVQKASHNIAIAMDTPRGLLVPVIRDCQEKSIIDIAQDLVALQALGADNKLGEKELSGGTFTLSNIGAIGGTYASPIIPSPTVVIGALGRIQTVPRFSDPADLSSVYASKVMNISWAADHRVVDGASIARFSNQLKTYIQEPLTMVSDLS